MPEPTILHRPAPGQSVGIDEAMVRDVVHRFYERIRTDEALGPIFAAVISDWEPHLAKMCDFWSSMLLMTKRYEGRPVPVHLQLQGIGREHFARWLALFEETPGEVAPPEAAALFIDRAHRVAQSLQLAIDFRNGVLPPLKAPIRAG